MSDLDNMKMKAEAKVEELAAKARYEAEKAEPDGGESESGRIRRESKRRLCRRQTKR